jgi:acetyl-CoA carboxylase biotin carboxyl carrier protein
MAETEATAEDVFDLDRIRRLVELMKEHDLSEIDLREAEQRIRLCRGGGDVVPYVQAAPPVPAASAPASAAPSAPADAAEDESHIVFIKSPMVGTFYSRPNPNTDAFVRVGDSVDEDTIVCVVEAMKVFNEIPAEVRGRVVAILVDDEEPVEFGKPLFKVDTSK